MSHGYERINRIVGIWYDGRTVAKGVTRTVATPMCYVTITVPNLKFIEEILNIQVHTTDPPLSYTDLGNKDISGNVVGITISGPATATTMLIEAICVGV